MKNQKRRSLNEMVLGSLASLQESADGLDACLTARDVTNHIESQFEVEYPIQTIIVVLNRLVKKGLVSRVANNVADGRHRYCFYLNQSPQELWEDRMFHRFQAFADEFFKGDLELALHEVNKIVRDKVTQGA